MAEWKGNVQSQASLFAKNIAHLEFSVIHSCGKLLYWITLRSLYWITLNLKLLSHMSLWEVVKRNNIRFVITLGSSLLWESEIE